MLHLTISHKETEGTFLTAEIWSILCTRLDCPPTEILSLLRELSVTEAKKFLHCCGILVQCDVGNIITTQGDISYAYHILISGKLKSLTYLRPVKEYTLPLNWSIFVY